MRTGTTRSRPAAAPRSTAAATAATAADASASAAEIIRRSYFAATGGAALRYGVRPERIVEHFEAARPARATHLSRLVANVDDLIHAAACADDSELAWRDLADLHAAALVRSLVDQLGPIDAVLHVRRWLTELRHGTIRGSVPSRGGEAPTSLRSYNGLRPLRHWLADRLLGQLGEKLGSGFVCHRPGRRQPALRLTGSDAPLGFTSSARG